LNELIFNKKKTVRKEVCWTLSNITAGNYDQIRIVIQNKNIILKLKDVEFNKDICVPLYIHKCIKIEYDNAENIPVKIEMIYSVGLLKHKYKNNITNIIFP
jgi:hypothetical protein